MLDSFYILMLKSLEKPIRSGVLHQWVLSCQINPASVEALRGWLNSQPNTHYTEMDIEKARQKAQLIIDQCQRQSIQLMGYHDLNFPATLKAITDPPLLLFVKGDPTILRADQLFAVIGTRTPSERGLVSAKRLSQRLAEQGYVVVSGLALGCDKAAHEGCLAGGGKTIAVLAHGLDSIYPKENQTLAREIVTKGGCLISEYAPGIRANKFQFVARNRLQSGLSQAVIIIECDIASGTMHTATFAKAQHKPIACLTYSDEILHAFPTINISGNQQLIRQGATPFLNKESLSEFLERVLKKKVQAMLRQPTPLNPQELPLVQAR